MSDRLIASAGELRDAFDRSFAQKPVGSTTLETLLAIRIAGDAFALRIRDVVEIATRRTLVRIPAGTPELLGLASVRGRVVPVFGLTTILGYPPAGDPRWMIVCKRAADADEHAIALAFSELEGVVQVPASAIYVGDVVGRYAREIVRTADGVRRLVEVAEILAEIRGRGPEKEQ